MIEGLLAYSRISRADAATQAVDLTEATEQTLQGLQTQLDRSGTVVSLRPPLPVVRASPPLVTQILGNLLVNALTYGVVPGEVTDIEVGCDDLGTEWRLYVRDQGPGIPEEQQARMFGMFERLPAGKAANPHGSGLGLAVVRKAAEALGGHAGVDSALGHGATFWVRFPKMLDSALDQAVPDSSSEPALAPTMGR
jgi:signal transduction histidine kinase